MELVATIWDATKCLCNCTSKHAAFICHLEENLQSLAEEWTQLQNLRHDVNTRVQHAERMAHMRRTGEVEGWLQRVNSMEQTVKDIQQRSAKVVQNRCLGKVCQKNCLSSYNLGKEVVNTLDAVKKLMTDGKRIDSVAYEVPREPVDEIPVPKTVGMDLMLNKVWDSIEDKNVGTIGLYGMGGSGKTTLMKKLNNELAKTRHDFALVIWVVVSKDFDINQIMDKIRQGCRIDDKNWMNKSKDDKEKEIYSVMKQKKFILLLDDLWKELELHQVGVPLLNETNQSKIVFTTRFENVCDQMQAKKFKVECLTEKEALDLFCMKVGEETLDSHSDIRVLAKELVQECKGLPLALITIGRAMASRKSPQAWKHAITELQSFPSEVLGMEEEVFFTLKFSYDRLPTAIDKKCFLYCALYPEDEEIYVPHLIRLWIGEGFLDGHDSIHDAYNKGDYIVESLKMACLLEGVKKDFIKMHDVIRDMALWLARDQDQNKNKILVQCEALGSSQANNLEKWRTTEMISMMLHNFKASNWHVPICPQLVTLIVDMRKLYINNFVNIQFMSGLRVLKLRGIGGIFKLPTEIGQLIHLEYLELSILHIKERFPMEMKNLKSLKVFIMQYVQFSLEIIPLEVISSLEGLRVLSFWDQKIGADEYLPQKMKSLLLIAIHSRHTVEKSFLEKLELLPLLQELNITLETTTGINKLLSSTKLQHCVREVGLQQYRTAAINIPIISSMANMEHLERIALFGLQGSVEEFSTNHIYTFRRLRSVYIMDCHSITHLTWLKYAPLLEFLRLQKCNLVEEVITESEDDKNREKMDEIFSKLESLVLINLPKLKSFCKKLLPFPMLRHIHVIDCPNLKKLPFDSNSARKCSIGGETEWWNNLEWEDSATKDLFNSRFGPIVFVGE